MNTYKITNVTHLLGKRDLNYNMTLKVDYTDQLMRKNIDLKPAEVLYFTVSSLPISLHKYRIKGLISVSEISPKELKNEIKAEKTQKIDNVVKLDNKQKSTTTTTTTKKETKSTSKSKSSSTSKSSKSKSSNSTEKTIDIVSASSDDD